MLSGMPLTYSTMSKRRWRSPCRMVTWFTASQSFSDGSVAEQAKTEVLFDAVIVDVAERVTAHEVFVDPVILGDRVLRLGRGDLGRACCRYETGTAGLSRRSASSRRAGRSSSQVSRPFFVPGAMAEPGSGCHSCTPRASRAISSHCASEILRVRHQMTSSTICSASLSRTLPDISSAAAIPSRHQSTVLNASTVDSDAQCRDLPRDLRCKGPRIADVSRHHLAWAHPLVASRGAGHLPG